MAGLFTELQSYTVTELQELDAAMSGYKSILRYISPHTTHATQEYFLFLYNFYNYSSITILLVIAISFPYVGNR